MRGISGTVLAIGCLAAALPSRAADPRPLPELARFPIRATLAAPPSFEAVSVPLRLRPSVANPGTFVSGYLAPQVGRRLAGLAPVVGSPLYEQAPDLSVWRADVDRDVEHHCVRAARRAVRRWAADRLDLEVDLSRGRVASAAATTAGAGLRLGVSGGLPRISLERPVGDGTMRVRLEARGRVGLDWNRAGRPAALGATWDVGDRSVDVRWGSRF